MKALIIFMFLGFLCLEIAAQKVVEQRESLSSIDKVEIDFQFADDIIIKKWDKNEVYIKATVSINNDTNNDNFELRLSENSNVLSIESLIKDLDKIGKPRTVKDLETGEVLEMNCHIEMDLKFEVYLPANTNIELETISGNIETKDLSGNVNLHTISGDIDFYLNEKHNADIELNTISGEMYTDFDFKAANDGYHHYGSRNFTHTLNKGGNNIVLENISGNIYLRKLKP